jgi:hypothetical protein
MPNVLTLRPDEIDTNEKRSKYSVSVVGCGRKGILYAYAFAGAGFKVTCLDADPNVVKKLARGKTAFGEQEFEETYNTLTQEILNPQCCEIYTIPNEMLFLIGGPTGINQEQGLYFVIGDERRAVYFLRSNFSQSLNLYYTDKEFSPAMLDFLTDLFNECVTVLKPRLWP